jgi:acetyl-CoA acetyltransferase
VRAIEACGLALPGKGGNYLLQQHQRLHEAIVLDLCNHIGDIPKGEAGESLVSDPNFFTINNTHGGLLCYGAPWEVPAIFNVVEAVDQLRGQAKG